MKWIPVVALGLLACSNAVTKMPSATLIEDRRAAFRAAYDKADIAALCALLDENVSFRGRFRPGWTGPRDELIKRWTRGDTVDCKGTRGGTPGVRVVGTNTIVLSSSGTRELGPKTVLDMGTFSMVARSAEGQQYAVTDGKYVMIWAQDNAGNLLLKHIDMDP